MKSVVLQCLFLYKMNAKWVHGEIDFGTDYLSAKIASTAQNQNGSTINIYDHNTATFFNCCLNFKITFRAYSSTKLSKGFWK